MIREIEAEVSSFPVTDGGNPKPFSSGYRAVLHYDDTPENVLHAVEVHPHIDLVEPGDTAMCTIRLMYPEYHLEYATVGRKFELRDGDKLRAKGTVKTIAKLVDED